MARRYIFPSAAVLDSNFLVSCFVVTDRFHRDAGKYLSALVRSVESSGTTLCVSPRIIEEVLWAACKAYYEGEHGPRSFRRMRGGEQFSALTDQRDAIGRLCEQLLSSSAPYSILPVMAEDMAVAVDLATAHGVPLTDACHCALALRVADGNIITNDRHMERIPDVNCLPYLAPRP